MPNCFNLIRKSAPELGPVKLTEIDDEICKHLNIEPHPTKYIAGWMDNIGFGLAIGQNFSEIRKDFDKWIIETKAKNPGEQELNEFLQFMKLLNNVLTYIETNFVSNCWYSPSKN